MPVVLTVAEFNPLHGGHARFFRSVRDRYPEALLVCLMSGNFVQRGTPAVADRWTRAGMALLAGADVVLELPAFYAVQGAAGFARGAVRIAAGLGSEVLAFGAEAGNLEPLASAARLLQDEPEPLAAAIRDGSRDGLNYGAAVQRALASFAPDLAPLLSGANNMLGIEYLKAIQQLHTGLRPCVIPRTPAGGREFSAQAVREALRAAQQPDAVLEEWEVPLPFTPVFAEETLYRLALHEMRQHRTALRQTADVSPEVAARMLRAAGAPDYEAFLAAASTRWLPRARVRRALLSLALGFSAKMLSAANQPDSPLHTRLLGLRDQAESGFGSLASGSSTAIVSGCGGYPETVLAEGDLRAANLYATLQSPPTDPAADKAHRVVKLAGGRLVSLEA